MVCRPAVPTVRNKSLYSRVKVQMLYFAQCGGKDATDPSPSRGINCCAKRCQKSTEYHTGLSSRLVSLCDYSQATYACKMDALLWGIKVWIEIQMRVGRNSLSEIPFLYKYHFTFRISVITFYLHS